MVGSQRDKEANPKKQQRRNRKRQRGSKKCKKQKYRDYYIEEHGCRSKRPYKMAKCLGPNGENNSTECVPTKIKTRKIKFVCPDGSSQRKEVEIVRKCGRRKDKIWG